MPAKSMPEVIEVCFVSGLVSGLMAGFVVVLVVELVFSDVSQKILIRIIKVAAMTRKRTG